MADNLTLNSGSGGATAAADDIGGVHYQRVKISLGADGAATDALGGAGSVASGVQRVTLASDDPAVASIGGTADAEATGSGSLIAVTKRVRTLLTKNSRSDTYTGTGSGTTVDVSSAGMSRFGLQVKGTGASATSWTVSFDVSLDGTNFQSLFTHTNSNSTDGGVMYGPVGHYPALYFRSRCTAVSLGGATNIVATIVGMP